MRLRIETFELKCNNLSQLDLSCDYLTPAIIAKDFHFSFLHSVVAVEEAQNLCLLYNCQFYEVSAAENYSGVHLAFQSLLKEARSASLQRSLPVRRKLGVNSVSKVASAIAIIYFISHEFWSLAGSRQYFREEQQGRRS